MLGLAARGLPYCRAHDPQRKELRRQARAAGDAQVARVRANVNTASAEVLARVLEVLIVGRKVRTADVEAAFEKISDADGLDGPVR